MSQNSNFLRIFQTLCLSYLKTTSKGNLSKIEQYLGSKAQKRDHFIDAESIRKPLKIFYLYNHKYCTDESYQLYYLNKIFYLVKSWGVTQSARGHKQKTLKMSQKTSFLTQFRTFPYTSRKTVAYMMHHLACHHWPNFHTKLTTF